MSVDYINGYENLTKRNRIGAAICTFLLILGFLSFPVAFGLYMVSIIEQISTLLICFACSAAFLYIILRVMDTVFDHDPKKVLRHARFCLEYHARAAGMSTDEYKEHVNHVLNTSPHYLAGILPKHIYLTGEFAVIRSRIIPADEIMLIYYRSKFTQTVSYNNSSGVTIDHRHDSNIVFYTKSFGEVPILDLKKLRGTTGIRPKAVAARERILLDLKMVYPNAYVGPPENVEKTITTEVMKKYAKAHMDFLEKMNREMGNER